MYLPHERTLTDILEENRILSVPDGERVRERLAVAQDADEAGVLLDFVSETELTLARRSRELGVPCISLVGRQVDPEVLKTLAAGYAYQQKAVPLSIEGGALVVAVAEPQDVELVDELRVVTGRTVRVLMGDVEQIEDAIRRYYGKSAEALVTGELTGPPGAVTLETVTEIHDYGLQADVLARDPTVMEAVNQMIIDAVREGATDIHVEPFEEEVVIRVRIDGVLEARPSPPKHLQAAITSRIKLWSEMNISETRRPQDGRIQLRIATLGRREIDIRVSTIPTLWGESVAMRILDKNMMRRGLTQLGLTEGNLDDFSAMIQRPWGIILATGPTGSGKTTSLYACLHEIQNVGTKIITVEEPVEYDLEGVNQINVNPEIGVTFDRALRHILRQDPDKVMVGEIRDLETANMVVHTALTGHLVFSSLHTNDAPSAVTRLVSMGVDPYLVASTLEGIIAQRLPRKVCQACARMEKPTDEELRVMALDSGGADVGLVPRAVGCDQCRNTGHSGRIGIFEVIAMSEALRDMALQNASSAQIRRAARESGMRTLREDGWRKVRAGITTIEEVRRLTPEEDRPDRIT